MFQEKISEERIKAFKIINSERDYQDIMWPDITDERWSPSDWLIFIKKYVEKADEALMGAKTVDEGRRRQMENIRKIAALAVAAMENNETPYR